MTTRRYSQHRKRKGAVVVLVATMMVVLVALVAFAVDIGAVLKVKTDMQRSADAAVLAAAQALAPDPDGSQSEANAIQTVRDYVAMNLGNVEGAAFSVDGADIEIGRFDPNTIYQNVSLQNDGVLDTVRVTLRRDGVVNPRAPLFFGRALGIQDASLQVTSTAVLQKPNTMREGSDILPFAVHVDLWNDTDVDESFTVYGDGRVEDENGHQVPGNWGTCDIGDRNNSTSELNDQILNGLRQSDLDALHADGRIAQSEYIDGNADIWVEADTGLSSGLKHSVQEVHGAEKIIPIYDSLSSGNGNNLQYHIVDWGVVTVVDSCWRGANNTWVEVRRAHLYSGDLSAKPNSLSQPAAIDGAYASAVLVE